MTAHHFLPAVKKELYTRIRKSLKAGGAYIEGDFIVSPEREKEMLDYYGKVCEKLGAVEAGKYHIDIAFSLDTQIRLLMDAGFKSVEVVWVNADDAILIAKP
jgi:tRNA (cmo5U34)-methyltransferase